MSQIPPEKVPEDFGAENGTPISNKRTILREIDRALGVQKPPAIEYLFVEPFANFSILGRLGIAGNYYGHAAVRYTMPDGEEKVMNITGLPNGEMVHFVPAEDYLFGTTNFHAGSQQGGIYNRAMVGVRVENVDPELVKDLDHYYPADAKLTFPVKPLQNFLSDFIPVSIAERGNCARWTSMGLVEAGILRRPSLWPKKIAVNVFEQEGQKNPSNVNVVSYRMVKHAKRAYGAPPSIASGVEPLHSIENYLYYNLERFANVIVDVPQGTTTAHVETVVEPAKPNWWRHNSDFLFLSAAAVTLVAFRLFGGRAAVRATSQRMQARIKSTFSKKPNNDTPTGESNP